MKVTRGTACQNDFVLCIFVPEVRREVNDLLPKAKMLLGPLDLGLVQEQRDLRVYLQDVEFGEHCSEAESLHYVVFEDDRKNDCKKKEWHVVDCHSDYHVDSTAEELKWSCVGKGEGTHNAQGLNPVESDEDKSIDGHDNHEEQRHESQLVVRTPRLIAQAHS